MNTTVKSLDDLRRLALGKGAELVMDGKRFNSSREKMATPAAPKPAPPVPEPLAESANEDVSLEVVQALLAQRDAMWTKQLGVVIDAFKAALSSQNTAAPEAAPREWTFHVTYLNDGEIIESVHATSKP
jgi:hypothetical protein